MKAACCEHSILAHAHEGLAKPGSPCKVVGCNCHGLLAVTDMELAALEQGTPPKDDPREHIKRLAIVLQETHAGIHEFLVEYDRRGKQIAGLKSQAHKGSFAYIVEMEGEARKNKRLARIYMEKLEHAEARILDLEAQHTVNAEAYREDQTRLRALETELKWWRSLGCGDCDMASAGLRAFTEKEKNGD